MATRTPLNMRSSGRAWKSEQNCLLTGGSSRYAQSWRYSGPISRRVAPAVKASDDHEGGYRCNIMNEMTPAGIQPLRGTEKTLMPSSERWTLAKGFLWCQLFQDQGITQMECPWCSSLRRVKIGDGCMVRCSIRREEIT